MSASDSLLSCLPDSLVCSILSWIDGASIARLEVRREPAIPHPFRRPPNDPPASRCQTAGDRGFRPSRGESLAAALFAERCLVCAVRVGSKASWKQRLQMGYRVVRTRWDQGASTSEQWGARRPSFALRDHGRTAALTADEVSMAPRGCERSRDPSP